MNVVRNVSGKILKKFPSRRLRGYGAVASKESTTCRTAGRRLWRIDQIWLRYFWPGAKENFKWPLDVADWGTHSIHVSGENDYCTQYLFLEFSTKTVVRSEVTSRSLWFNGKITRSKNVLIVNGYKVCMEIKKTE